MVRPSGLTAEDIEVARCRAIRVRDALEHVGRQAAEDAQLDLTDLIQQAVAVP
eukprot:CAMPEP_0183435952 /NCGR_PEP_ID=MMETSP0370-20130417/68949_1 /TAXON_ID=268820 /ORGANISM="Peridinium aciculiferum, Strain PAER-2" /LENGTH=52 /DNA_ID=CAMNT_0025623249 /DNA_START=253 /DNA_END=411 /DNA_ORIENTATION=+